MARRKKKLDTYHHGNLKESCLKEGVRILKHKGIDQLSLRDIARNLGVSHGAPYRHFPNKEAVMAAIAAEGFKVFQTYTAKAWEGEGDLGRKFREMGYQYIRFANTHPEHYRLMFSATIPNRTHYEDLHAAGCGAFETLTKALGTLQEHGFIDVESIEDAAVFVWSTLHGYVALVANLKFDFLENRPLERSTVDHVLTSIELGLNGKGFSHQPTLPININPENDVQNTEPDSN